MLIVLLLFALFHTLQGVPLSSPAVTPDISNLDLRDTQSHLGQRTVNDIIVSCFATIIACTWSAIHPNIPSPMDCGWTRFKRQVTIMVYALLAPEFVLGWAFRQRIGAQWIVGQYNVSILGVRRSGRKRSIIDTFFRDAPVPAGSAKGPEWTLAHGFFLNMGGFMLSDCGKPIHTLFCSQMDKDEPETPWEKDLIYCIRNNIIDPPRITEEDIQDRSKGDAISKIVIILQTTWFIVQCLARWSQHLPVTELEVVTLGFAMLNGITYMLWWDKPQNVGRPMFLERKRRNVTSEASQNTLHVTDDSVPGITESSDGPTTADKKEPALPHSTTRNSSWLRRKLRASIEEEVIWKLLIAFPWHLFLAFFRPFGKLIACAPDLEDDYRAPMFYAAYTETTYAATFFTVPVIGLIFGSIHLIPSWFLDYPSQQEMWLWRGSALIVTAEPLLLMIIAALLHSIETNSHIGSLFSIILTALLWFCALLYPIARLILLILSLTCLRSLPPATLQAIDWNTFIPHL